MGQWDNCKMGKWDNGTMGNVTMGQWDYETMRQWDRNYKSSMVDAAFGRARAIPRHKALMRVAKPRMAGEDATLYTIHYTLYTIHYVHCPNVPLSLCPVVPLSHCPFFLFFPLSNPSISASIPCRELRGIR